MNKNLTESTKFGPHEFNNYTVQYNCYTTINTPYDWPTFLAASC